MNGFAKRAVALSCIVALLLFPAIAWAHARLERSQPAAGSRVGSPQIIRLWFSERPEVSLSGVSLKDQTGKDFPVGPAQPDATNPLVVSFEISAAVPVGRYTIAWRTVSSDGHPSHGSFTFEVISLQPESGLAAAVSTTPATTTRTPTASSTPQETAPEDEASSVSNSLTRALSFAGILVVIGVIVFNILVVARSSRIGSELVWRIESRAAIVGVAASVLVIAAAFGRIFLESRMMNDMPGMQTMSMTDMTMHTRWGFALRLEIIAAFLTLLAFSIAIRRVHFAWLIASVSAGVLAVTPALAGHAAATPRFTSLVVLTDALHVFGASSWLGNLACVMLIGVPIILRSGGEERWQKVAALVNTFSPVALASASVVVLSGLIASWVHLEHISDLWTTAYGQMLFRKLVFVALTVVVGAYNFRRVQPRLLSEGGTARLRRATTVELGLGVIILIFTGFLTGIAP